jgi:hypothetical protein
MSVKDQRFPKKKIDEEMSEYGSHKYFYVPLFGISEEMSRL